MSEFTYPVPIFLPRRRRIISPGEWLREKIKERQAERDSQISQAVTVDGSYPLNWNAGGPDAHALTLGAGTDRVLLAFFVMDKTDESITSVTWNTSETLTQIGTGYGATTWTKIQAFQLVNPTTGTHDLSTVWSNPTGNALRIIVYELQGVSQTTPFRAPNGGSAESATSISHAITGWTSGDYGIDVIAIDGSSHNPQEVSGQTPDYASFNTGSCDVRGSHDTADATLGWTWTNAAPYTHFAVAAIPVGAATQIARPDADIAAGGWATSPLFSKLNDQSDATVITNTAS